MGLNSRSYSGINAAVRFGDLNKQGTNSTAFCRPEGREAWWPQKRARNSLLRCRHPFPMKRKGLARYTTLSHFFSTPLLQPTTMPQRAESTNPNHTTLAHNQGTILLLTYSPTELLRWEPSSYEAPSIMRIVPSLAAGCQGVFEEK